MQNLISSGNTIGVQYFSSSVFNSDMYLRIELLCHMVILHFTFFSVPRIKLRALHVLGKCAYHELQTTAWIFFYFLRNHQNVFYSDYNYPILYSYQQYTRVLFLSFSLSLFFHGEGYQGLIGLCTCQASTPLTYTASTFNFLFGDRLLLNCRGWT